MATGGYSEVGAGRIRKGAQRRHSRWRVSKQKSMEVKALGDWQIIWES